jgi:hypothetical protein
METSSRRNLPRIVPPTRMTIACILSPTAAWPEAAPVEYAAAATEKNISPNGTYSHSAGFETELSQSPLDLAPQGSGESVLNKNLPEAMAYARLAGRKCPANGGDSPGRTGQNGSLDRPIDAIHSLPSPNLNPLAPVDVNLRPADIHRLVGAEEKQQVGDLVRLAQPAHRDFPLHDLLGARRQDGGVDFAR